jgi:hypothetical protein
MEQGASALQHQHVKDVSVGGEDVVGIAAGDCSDIDGVAVIVVEQEYVVISLARWHWESAHEARENVSCC